MVSKAREDLPEPLSPVITVRALRGISTSMFLRLCCRAPRTEILVMDMYKWAATLRNAEGSPRNVGKWGSAPLLRILVVTTGSGQRGYSEEAGQSQGNRMKRKLWARHLSKRARRGRISERILHLRYSLLYGCSRCRLWDSSRLHSGARHSVRLWPPNPPTTPAAACAAGPQRSSRGRLSNVSSPCKACRSRFN